MSDRMKSVVFFTLSAVWVAFACVVMSHYKR